MLRISGADGGRNAEPPRDRGPRADWLRRLFAPLPLPRLAAARAETGLRAWGVLSVREGAVHAGVFSPEPAEYVYRKAHSGDDAGSLRAGTRAARIDRWLRP